MATEFLRRTLLVTPLAGPAWGRSAVAQTPAERVAPGGVLRAAVIVSNPVLVQRADDGSLGGVTVEVAQALARALSVPLQIVPYENPVRYNESIGRMEWDVGLAARDAAREAVLAFSVPFMEVDGGYVARPGVTGVQAAQVDVPGMRIAVAQGSAPDTVLTRMLHQATLVRIQGGIGPARAALSGGTADLYADNLHICHQIARQVTGAVVLDGRFNTVRMAVAVPKSRAAAMDVVDELVRTAVASGMVAAAIQRAGLVGVRAGGQG